jgi:8-oxo-dGTP pyrophosphatase MutT (NUDIX family)
MGFASLIDQLRSFKPRSYTEQDDLAIAMATASASDPWGRDTLIHFTASALVVHPPTQQVLLRWHQRQQAWIQIGGHGDPGETDPLAIALREGAEETRITDLRPWPNAALCQVVVVSVPGNGREPDHRHIDLRYVLATDRPDMAGEEHDGAAVRWLTVDDATALTTEPNVRELIRRAGDLMTSLAG